MDGTWTAALISEWRDLRIVYRCISGKGELAWIIEFLEEGKLLTRPYPTNSPTFTFTQRAQLQVRVLLQTNIGGNENVLTIRFQWPLSSAFAPQCSTSSAPQVALQEPPLRRSYQTVTALTNQVARVNIIYTSWNASQNPVPQDHENHKCLGG